jgi:hypothetical protein
MQTTMLNKNSKIRITKSGIGKIAIAMGLGLAICGTTIGPAFAGGGHGGDKHHEARHGSRHDRGHEHERGPVYVVPNYYAPPPNYYYAPEPEYYPAEPVYSAPAPSEGVNLFFGIR